ncbi:MAG: NAD-dependent epimerase/dehydratase family protein [Gammaproteobacteria bacterium]
MNEANMPKTVLVTGATGYVAGWVVKRLLEQGHTVHAAVRDPSRKDKIAHLDAMAVDLPGQIAYFKSDLLEPGSYTQAMQSCEIVFHTASPFTLNVTDPQRDLVDPAVKGTRNVLASVEATASVQRVVLTSSCAAIYGDNADMAHKPAGHFTEADWNTSSSLDHQPYSYSKVEAEKAAWAMAETQSRWELVVVNPSLVLGPGTRAEATSESFNIMRQMGDGTFKTGAPNLRLGAVDVRDVAEAHVSAGLTPKAHGRYIVSGTDSGLLGIAAILRREFGPDWPFPSRKLPKWLVWLVGPLADKTLSRKMIARNVGWPLAFDNSKSKTELGITYRALEESVRDMFQQLIDNKVVEKP